MGAAVPPRSVCWHAKLVVRGSGCHRAGTRNLPSQGRLRAMGSQRKLSRVPVSENWLREATSAQRSRPEEDRRPVEGRLGGSRTAAADERINRPAPPDIPSQNLKKKIALRAGLDTTSPSVSHRGSPASGTRPSTITGAAQDTGTTDVTGEIRPELAQGKTQPSGSDDTRGNVGMEEENGDECSTGHPNPSRSNSIRRITTERQPREARDEQSTATEQHVPRRMLGKTTPQGHTVAVTTQEALDGSREKTMRVANVENNSLNWASISSARALDMTNCDFSARPARDEMRRIIGSSELGVIIGSGRDRSRECRKTDKDHTGFLREPYEAQAARGRHVVHELTSEVDSRVKCVAKITAMPGTRTAVADLCMFGLAACDERGPGFVNASVRSLTRDKLECGWEVYVQGRTDMLRPTRTTQSRKRNEREHGHAKLLKQWRN